MTIKHKLNMVLVIFTSPQSL